MEKQIHCFNQLINLVILIQIHKKFTVFVKVHKYRKNFLKSLFGFFLIQIFISCFPKEQNHQKQIQTLLNQVEIQNYFFTQSLVIKSPHFLQCLLRKIFQQMHVISNSVEFRVRKENLLIQINDI